jgi:hypothetical protein
LPNRSGTVSTVTKNRAPAAPSSYYDKKIASREK